jgi:uncharacterized membrane protein YfcA
MKFYATTPRQYAAGILICMASCAVIGLLLNAVLPAGWAFLAAAVLLPFLLVRMVIALRRRWVYVGPQGVAWRTPKRPGFTATPTGSVTLDQVTGYQTKAQPIGRRSGQIVILTLAGGGTVRLPIWGQAGQMDGPQHGLLQALRATVKPTAAPSTFDT